MRPIRTIVLESYEWGSFTLAQFTGRSAEGMGEVEGTVRKVWYHPEVVPDRGHVRLVGWCEAFEVRVSEVIRPLLVFFFDMLGRQAHLVEVCV